MKLKTTLKNPIVLGTSLGLIYLIMMLAQGYLGYLSGPIIITIGTIFLVIINYGLLATYKSLVINHLKFIIFSSLLIFTIRFIIEKDINRGLQTLFALLIWLIISSLIINSIKIMKKGHWITIIILSILTIGFMLYSFTKNVEIQWLRSISEERRDRADELQKQIEAKNATIDSLQIEIEKRDEKK
jgi:hypothetical protein